MHSSQETHHVQKRDTASLQNVVNKPHFCDFEEKTAIKKKIPCIYSPLSCVIFVKAENRLRHVYVTVNMKLRAESGITGIKEL